MPRQISFALDFDTTPLRQRTGRLSEPQKNKLLELMTTRGPDAWLLIKEVSVGEKITVTLALNTDSLGG